MIRWKLPLAAVFAAVMSLLAAGTAHADSPRAYHGSDWGQIRTVGSYSYHDVIYACDAEADGRYVWAQYHLVGGGINQYRSVYDMNGPNNGCAYHDYRGTPYYARAIRICEYEGGCGAWKYTGDPVPAAATTKVPTS
jgi:hypothetical protein